MDWDKIKDIICAGRDFKVTDDGCSVLSDVIFPSGGLIRVHLQMRTDHLMAHDGGAAFDELARNSIEVQSMHGVRKMLGDSGLKLSDQGVIWADRLTVDQAHAAVILVADGSARAASFMESRASKKRDDPLDVRVRRGLRARFPDGRERFEFAGRHKQHMFDFGMKSGDHLILVQSVSPESSSISSAIVKALDAKAAEGSNVVPILVFDQNEHWNSGSLGMLEIGGRPVEVGAAISGHLPLAA